MSKWVNVNAVYLVGMPKSLMYKEMAATGQLLTHPDLVKLPDPSGILRAEFPGATITKVTLWLTEGIKSTPGEALAQINYSKGRYTAEVWYRWDGTWIDDIKSSPLIDAEPPEKGDLSTGQIPWGWIIGGAVVLGGIIYLVKKKKKRGGR